MIDTFTVLILARSLPGRENGGHGNDLYAGSRQYGSDENIMGNLQQGEILIAYIRRVASSRLKTRYPICKKCVHTYSETSLQGISRDRPNFTHISLPGAKFYYMYIVE